MAIAPGTCRADSHRDAYSSSLLTMKKAMFSKNHVLKDFVIHCQDHQPGHFMMFCPCLYYESSVRTWNAPDIFEQLEGSTEFHRQTTLQAIPAWVRKEYQWGLDTSASLPYGYVLLKRKKQFLCRTNHRRIPWHNSCKVTYRRCFGVETASYQCRGV